MCIRQWSTLWTALAVTALIGCGGGDADDTAEAPEAPAPSAQAPAQPQSNVPADVELPDGVTPEMVTAGEQLFATSTCYTCHAVDGSGTALAPNLRDGEWLNADGTMESIRNVIRNGVPTPVQHPAAMPAMGGAQLSDEQIDQLAAYVFAISHGGA